MSRHAKFSDQSVIKAKEAVFSATGLRDLRAAQAVILSARFKLTMEEVAEVLGVSRSQVGILQSEARDGKKSKSTSHGGRRRQMMSLEEEKDFLKPWEQEASSAGMVIVPPLHQALEKHLGRKVHASQVYRLLARHGWRKLSPDSVHPKTDEAKQEDWKKNSRKWWPPISPAPKPKERGHA